MQRFTTLALMLVASTAYANDPVETYSRQFHDYVQYRTALDQGNNVGGQPGDCAKDIAKAKAEGVPADAVFTIWFDGKKTQLTFDGVAKQVCEPYERAYEAKGVMDRISKAREDLDWREAIDVATSSPDDAKRLAKHAEDCLKAYARVQPLGIGDREVWKVHLDEAKEKICDPLAKAAASFADDIKKAADAAEAEAQAPFKAVGIKGDKLFTCTQYHVLRGIGGGELEPAQIKKANVLFALQGGDGNYTLYRFQFKGDKLVRTTSQDFYLRPKAKAYR